MTEFLAEYYPEIPENLRGPIVIAASLGAKRAALMHTVAEKNVHSENPEKIRIAAEAASSLSFWSLGLRPSFRYDSVPDGVVTLSVQTAAVPSRSVLAQSAAFSSTPVSQNTAVSTILASAQLPVPMSSFDPEFEAMFSRIHSVG